MAQSIVIFGALGDLTSRKLIPALYELHRKKRLPEQTRIIGFSRTPFADDAWRQRQAESTAHFMGETFDQGAWATFAPMLFYHAGDIERLDDFAALRGSLDKGEGVGGGSRIYYLATAPRFYEPAIGHLGEAGLADSTRPDRRVVIEKPFGTDSASAHRLNEVLHQCFSERQIYRIDHYLGKETVQNVLVMRFANAIFEPVWNRNYVDHIEITAAEELAIGHRAGYYDSAGVLRDMFQNHLIQLLTYTAMEPPAHYDADAVRDEMVKVLRSIRPMTAEEVAKDTLRASTAVTVMSRGSRPAAERRRLPQSSSWSKTGGGKTCRSFYAAARRWTAHDANRCPVSPAPACSVRGGVAERTRREPVGDSDSTGRGRSTPL